ncbi:MAG: ATP-binding cassette domain-containing protein [Pseudomonadota bacterium]
MSTLELDGVEKAYDDRTVVGPINLTLASGAFCTIVGASGCGKSTLLKLLLGQERPTRGAILLDGEPLKTEPDPRRGIVYQRYSVFPHLTAAQNVRLGLELRHGDPVFGLCFGATRRSLRAQALALLAAVGLKESADRYPVQLSGGMQQRLALAQALACKPPLLLLDEPFGALDPGNRAAMHELLTQLWHEHGMTVVMVTHDLPEAFGLGTRMLVLDRPDDLAANDGARITYDLPLRAPTVATADAQTP